MPTSGRRGDLGVALATLLAPLSWGTSYVTITELLPSGRPLFVAWMRVFPAALVLLALSVRRGWWRPAGREWGRTMVLAACNFGIFFPLLFVAAYRLPGGVAAAGGGLQPLFVATLTTVVTGVRLRPRDLAVGVAAAIGVGLVVIRPGASIDPVGVLAAVAANASFACGIVLTKRFPVPPNRLAATGWQLLGGAAVLAPVALLVEGAPPTLTARGALGYAHLSLVGTALAYMLWFRGIRRLPAAGPPLLGLAAPITGATLGWLVLDESLSPLQLIGFALTCSAIAYGATLGGGAAPPQRGADPASGHAPARPSTELSEGAGTVFAP